MQQSIPKVSISKNDFDMEYFRKLIKPSTNTVILLEDIFLDERIQVDEYDDAIHQFFFATYKNKYIKNKGQEYENLQENMYESVNVEDYNDKKDEQIDEIIDSDDVKSIKTTLNQIVDLNTKIQLSKGSSNESFEKFNVFSKSCVFNGLKIINDFKTINPEVYGFVFNLINNIISRRCCIILDDSVRLMLKLFVSYFVYYNVSGAKDFLKSVTDANDVYKFFGMCFMVHNVHKKFDNLFRLDTMKFKDESEMNKDLKERLSAMKYYDSIRPNKLILDYTGMFRVIKDLCELTKINGYNAVSSFNSAMHFVKENFIKCLKCMDKIDVMFMYRMIFNITIAKYENLKEKETLKNQINQYYQSFVIYFNSLSKEEVKKLSVSFWISGMPLDFIYIVSEVDRQIEENNEEILLEPRHIYIEKYFQSEDLVIEYKKSLTRNRPIALETSSFESVTQQISKRDENKRFGLSSDILVTCVNKSFQDQILNTTCKKYSVVYIKNQLYSKSKDCNFLSYTIKNFEALVEINEKAIESKKIDYTHLENANLLFNILKKKSGYLEGETEQDDEKLNEHASEVFTLNFMKALIENIGKNTEKKYSLSKKVSNFVEKENICDKYILKFKSENDDGLKLKNKQLIGISNTDMGSLLKDIRKTMNVDDETFNTVYHLMRYKYIVDDMIVSTERLDEIYGNKVGLTALKDSVFVLLDRMSSQCDKTFQECISKFLENYSQNLYPENIIKQITKDLKTMMISQSDETINNFVSEFSEMEQSNYIFDFEDNYVFEKDENDKENQEKDESKYLKKMSQKISASEDIVSLDKLSQKIQENLSKNGSSMKKEKIDSILKETLNQSQEKSSSKKLDSVKKEIKKIVYESDEPMLIQIDEIDQLLNTSNQDEIVQETIDQNPGMDNEDLALQSIENATNKSFKKSFSKKKSQSVQNKLKSQSKKNFEKSKSMLMSLSKEEKKLAKEILEKSLSDLKNEKQESKENIIDDDIELNQNENNMLGSLGDFDMKQNISNLIGSSSNQITDDDLFDDDLKEDEIDNVFGNFSKNRSKNIDLGESDSDENESDDEWLFDETNNDQSDDQSDENESDDEQLFDETNNDQSDDQLENDLFFIPKTNNSKKKSMQTKPSQSLIEIDLNTPSKKKSSSKSKSIAKKKSASKKKSISKSKSSFNDFL